MDRRTGRARSCVVRRLAAGEQRDEAQVAYDEVKPQRFADLAEVAERWSDSDRVVAASNVAADRVSAFNLWQVPAFFDDLDGTRVAFEAIHETGLELDALITLGSPLGIERYVRRRLSAPDRMPRTIGRWINIAHPNEPVALVPELVSRFTPAKGQAPIEDLVLDTNSPWHGIDTYLRHDAVRRAIWTEVEPLVPTCAR